jgi:hypothetical protein
MHLSYVTEGKNISQQAKPASVTPRVTESGVDVMEEDENEVMTHIAKAKGEPAHMTKTTTYNNLTSGTEGT